MKKRIQIDSSLLSAVIVFTGVLFAFKNFYLSNIFLDNILDMFGLIFIIKGSLLRMSARGHKKTFSKNSQALVMTGPYSVVRNPMYLGSFLLGAGFVLMLWPWWMFPLFALVFIARFNRTIAGEEGYLAETFPAEFKNYCKKVPRLFPTCERIKSIKPREIFDVPAALSTKEAWGLLGWPVLSVMLETLQERLVFGATDIIVTLSVFAATALLFILGFWLSHRLNV